MKSAPSLPETAAECRDYLWALRWPQGFRCPRCGKQKTWPVSELLRECAGCGRQVSATAGTIFQDSHVPLKTWFRAAWWMISQKGDASGTGLQEALDLRSYKTAWTLLRKLRLAMADRDHLRGRVEAREIVIGLYPLGASSRKRESKVLVAVAVEQAGRGIGRMRLRSIRSASVTRLMRFIEESVERGSVVITDEWKGYEPLSGKGYGHEARGRGNAVSPRLPGVRWVEARLGQWLGETHPRGMRRRDLDECLREFAFRFEGGRRQSRGRLFRRLLEQAVATAPVPYQSLLQSRGDPRARPK